MKNVVKALNTNTEALTYPKGKFIKISDVKIEERIFVDPQITALLKDVKFDTKFYGDEKGGYFKVAVTFFFPNKRAIAIKALLHKVY